jgi:hypothetical protein
MRDSGASFVDVMTRTVLAALAVLTGLSVAFGGAAHAEPTTPSPGPATTSTDDELTDMVMDALAPGPTAPTTTPVPEPPH